MNQTFLGKSKEEQEKDFKEYFGFFADKDCKNCYGTGKSSWMTELDQYIICNCVLVNIEKEKEIQESRILKVKEVIN